MLTFGYNREFQDNFEDVTFFQPDILNLITYFSFKCLGLVNSSKLLSRVKTFWDEVCKEGKNVQVYIAWFFCGWNRHFDENGSEVRRDI